jgi:hypothetical protein
MPRAMVADHASASDLSERQAGVREESDNTVQSLTQRRAVRDPDVQSSDEEDVVPRAGQYVDKRSFDYVWRSGVAGGVAGCAVSRRFSLSANYDLAD